MNRLMTRHSVPLSLWIYQKLLVLYPSEYRREYGPHMLQLFSDCYRDAHAQAGSFGVVHLWLFTLIDLVKTAVEERSRQRIQLTKQLFVRLSGLAAMLGGALWMKAILIMSSRPPGGPGRMHRQTDDLLVELMLAMLLIVCGLAGAHARQFSQSRWWGMPGAIAIVASPLLSGLSHVLGIWELFFGGWMLLLFGTLFSAVLMTTGNTVPRWATPLLILGSLILLGFNTEDNRAYLALPFGLAAIVLGLALILDKKPEPST